MNRSILAAIAAFAFASAGSAQAPSVKITSDTFGGLAARAIGPATPSGRIAAIDAVASDPLTLYVGSASGGVWKSSDGGVSFKPVFDEHTQSIGAVRVDPSNPKSVWVGTGESWTRNSVSVGTGVYKTTDGGDSWQHMGLKNSERIARIQVSSKSADTVFVCATGQLWSPNEERGVFKTSDGGKTWAKTLYVDADTGCGDLAIDPQDPSTLYAGMWSFRRRPDFFTSGGKGSGLYKTTDGGTTWKKIENGIPAGEKGRIAIAVAPSRPNVLYALVEAKKTALYRSDDTGASWREVNSSFNLTVRPFYFAHLVVDPQDFDTVYKPGLFLTVSTDGGKSFNSPFAGFNFGSVHSDHHALWIHPKAPNEMLLGTDGGLYLSWDRGRAWQWAKNLPVAQFYRVSVDAEVPYNVYGGLQDNGSWMGPSRSIGGIEGRDWQNVGVGDGFWVMADPKDPGYLYSEYQGGNLARVNTRTGEMRSIKPYANLSGGEEDLRFNWNTPMHLSPNEPGTLYYGAQYLFRSRDRGETWERISPDLTTDDPKRQQQETSGGLSVDNSTAENNTTIYSISESPKNGAVVWVGTDDGNVQVTRDGGKTWTHVSANLPDAPKGGWVSSVTAGSFDGGTAFVTVDDHRRGDMKPYVYRTQDFGTTWQSLVTPEVEGYAWKLTQDTVNPNLYFLGTEFGLYISLDSGRQWARFTGNLPKVAVHDMAIHPRDGDLVLATHGRGVYILDDLAPLRALTQQTIDSDVALLPSRPAEMSIEAQVQTFTGNDEFVGQNPPESAYITYWLKKRHLFGDLKAEVYAQDGTLITTIPGTKRVGLNRIEWPMRLRAPKLPASTQLVPTFSGPRVAEGAYKVKLIKGKETVESEVHLVPDRRSKQSPEDRALQQKTAMQIYDDLEHLTYVAESLATARKDLAARSEKLAKGDGLRSRLDKLAKTLEDFGATFVATSENWISGEEKLREKLGNLYGAVNQYEGRPTNSQMTQLGLLRKDFDGVKTRFETLKRDVAAASAEVVKKKLEPVVVPSVEEWKKKEEAH